MKHNQLRPHLALRLTQPSAIVAGHCADENLPPLSLRPPGPIPVLGAGRRRFAGPTRFLLLLLLLGVAPARHGFAGCDGYGGDGGDCDAGGGGSNLIFTTNASSAAVIGVNGLILSGVVIPSSYFGLPVTRVGPSAFAGNYLTSVTIPGSVTEIGDSAFSGCANLSSITISNGVTKLGDSAFNGCSSLTNVKIPNSVTSIGSWTFGSCSGLTNIIIPGGVTNIGGSAFSGCINLTTITVDALNSAYSSVGGVLFDKNQNTIIQCPQGRTGSYTIPNSVTNIGGSAFSDCTSLLSITIPGSVTNIGGTAFSGCINLRTIFVDALNPAYSSAGGVLFDKNQNMIIQFPDGKLGSYTIPNTVTNIGSETFSTSTKLTIIIIPGSVASIGGSPFSGCISLTTITVDALNSAYSSVGGVLFDKNQETLIQCPGRKAGNYSIPNSVTTIGEAAFVASSLTNVTIPNSVSSIRRQAFYGCTSLNSITIPDSVTSIGDTAFAYCTGLKSVTIPDSVTSIGDWTFAYCTGLNSITIPSGVTHVGNFSFYFCTSLTNITVPNSVITFGDYALSSCPKLSSIYVQGSPPTLGFEVFNSTVAIVYYLPGTTGWGATFGGRPTALWSLPSPLILNNGPSFGVQTNRFGFIISWAMNIPVVVEACTDLAVANWSPVRTNTLSGGWSYFSDPEWTNYPSRIYRVRSN